MFEVLLLNQIRIKPLCSSESAYNLTVKKMSGKVKILGISGSPRKGRNTDFLVKEALESAAKFESVKTEFVSLADYKITPCNGRNHCLKEDRCPIEDDMQILAKKLLEADGIIVGSPVYYMTVSGILKNFMDRSRYLRMVELKLKDKVGGAIAVAGLRNGGQEFTIAAIHNYFLGMGMIVVGPTVGGNTITLGGVGTLYEGVGEKGIKWRRVSEDEVAIETSRGLGERVARLALALKKRLNS